MTYHGVNEFTIKKPLRMAHVMEAAGRASRIGVKSLFAPRVHVYNKWRAATWFVINDYLPHINRHHAAKILGRHHSTLIHHERKRRCDPLAYREEIKAIKDTLAGGQP